jgi:hypothetical protein
VWDVGFAKLGDEWRLAASRRIRTRTGSDSWGDDKYEYEDLDEVPLAQAPRVVRAEAAGLLELLIDAIANRAEQFVANITTAKGLAKS